jgi:hypothetical protein
MYVCAVFMYACHRHAVYVCLCVCSTYCVAWGAAGIGGTKLRPVSVCDSRNALETADDPHWGDSVLVRPVRAQSRYDSATLSAPPVLHLRSNSKLQQHAQAQSFRPSLLLMACAACMDQDGARSGGEGCGLLSAPALHRVMRVLCMCYACVMHVAVLVPLNSVPVLLAEFGRSICACVHVGSSLSNAPVIT